MRSISTFFALILLLCMGQTSFGQRRFSDLSKVAEAIEQKVHTAAPEWKCHVVEPVTIDGADTSKVTIRQWSSEKQNVRVAIIRHQSEEEAATTLRQFALDKSANGRVPGLGDEGFAWGIRGSIAFRLGNITVYVTAIVISDADPAELLRNPNQARQKAAQAETDEEARITKVFVQHVISALAAF